MVQQCRWGSREVGVFCLGVEAEMAWVRVGREGYRGVDSCARVRQTVEQCLRSSKHSSLDNLGLVYPPLVNPDHDHGGAETGVVGVCSWRLF